MEEFLIQLKGKKIDISFGSNATVRGEVIGVKDGVLHLIDEDKRIAYVSVARIAVIWEADENHNRPGFVG